MKNITSNWRLKVLLVRHAQSEANVNRILQGQTDGKLTEKGIAQAHLLAEHFSKKSLDMIISSDLLLKCSASRCACAIPFSVNVPSV